MKINKIGGGVSSSAETIKKLPNMINKVIKNHVQEPVVIVISAFGKMTNCLNEICKNRFNSKNNIKIFLNIFKDFHKRISLDLFDSDSLFHQIENYIENIFFFLEEYSSEEKKLVDQILPIGEILASSIVSQYLRNCGISCTEISATNLIMTDDNFGEAKVNRQKTKEAVKSIFTADFVKKNTLVITQGFIGKVYGGDFLTTSTLGREGSDYTAGILGNLLNSSEVVLWKRVVGELPSFLTYSQCEELLEGELRGLIHPKTLNEVREKKIPLHIKDFFYPEKSGMVIN